MEYTYSLTKFRNYEKQKWFGLLQNKICTCLLYVDVHKKRIGETSRQEGHITDYSKAKSKVQPTMLRYSSTRQFVIHFVVFHNDIMAWNKFIVAFFFLEGFTAKQQNMPKKQEITTAL